MKRFLSLMTIVALMSLAAPVMAGDTSFPALSKLPATARTPMTNAQLAAIEGRQNVCVICANVAAALNLLSPGATATTGNQRIN
jgi:hypothetical protein